MNNELTKPEHDEILQSDEQSAEMNHHRANVTRAEDALSYMPRFDVWRLADKILLEGELPGVAPEDLDIQYEDSSLTVVGNVAQRSSVNPNLVHEYGFGNYRRTFRIGSEVDVDGISARLDNGIVTIELPIHEKAKPRRITVETDASA